VARAKRTNRAEARRRYRAQVAEQANAEALAAGERRDQAERSARPEPSRGSRPAAEAPQSGMRYAFRAAFRPPNLREDIEHLPQLLTSRAVLAPIIVSIATAVVIAATNGTDVISRVLAQYFLVPPPIGSIFVAGFFAPRASYLAGLIVGLAAALALTALVIATPALGSTTTGTGASPSPSAAASAVASGSPGTSPTASPAAPSAAASPAASGAGGTATANPADVAGFALIWSPLAGIVLASAAAWYRRFLQLSNPNRGAARSGARGRPNNRRR
jgi:hypothetical protein